MPEFFAFAPALHRGEPIPFGPFAAHQFFRLNHPGKLAQASGGQNKNRRGKIYNRLHGLQPFNQSARQIAVAVHDVAQQDIGPADFVKDDVLLNWTEHDDEPPVVQTGME